MRLRSLLLALSAVATVLFWCALGTAAGPVSASGSAADTSWVWPLAPDKPRIRHITTIITPQDLGVKKGFFGKLWEFIAGKDASSRVIAPHGMAVESDGKLYVADWGGKCIHFFDLEKKKYDTYSRTRIGALASPIGAAVDGDGLLYVSDSALRRVFVFKGNRNTQVIGDDAAFGRPTGIAINKADKRLYVVDTTGHRVDVLSLDGKRLFSIGKRGTGEGEFNYPVHIALDRTGTLFVMDAMNFRVQSFSRDGKFLRQFGRAGTGISDFIKPKGIAVDSEGHVWVSDGARSSIQVFDQQGRLLLIFGKLGIAKGEFNTPSGLFFDSKDRLYVADTYNYRIQMFQYLHQQ